MPIHFLQYRKEKSEGGIFCIPLFRTNRTRDDLVHYGDYDFPEDGLYAFGRLIEHAPANYDIVEIFRHVGGLPETPDALVRSGRLFIPVCMFRGLSTERYRLIFADDQYDKVRDSAYDEIIFLMHDSDIWVGGMQKTVSREEYKALEGAHEHMIIYSPTQLENRIRVAIKPFVNFEQAVAAMEDSLPRPDAD